MASKLNMRRLHQGCGEKLKAKQSRLSLPITAEIRQRRDESKPEPAVVYSIAEKSDE